MVGWAWHRAAPLVLLSAGGWGCASLDSVSRPQGIEKAVEVSGARDGSVALAMDEAASGADIDRVRRAIYVLRVPRRSLPTESFCANNASVMLTWECESGAERVLMSAAFGHSESSCAPAWYLDAGRTVPIAAESGRLENALCPTPRPDLSVILTLRVASRDSFELEGRARPPDPPPLTGTSTPELSFRLQELEGRWWMAVRNDSSADVTIARGVSVGTVRPEHCGRPGVVLRAKETVLIPRESPSLSLPVQVPVLGAGTCVWEELPPSRTAPPPSVH